MKIDWKLMWKDFDAWILNLDKPPCKTCGYRSFEYPDWEDQQKKIQSLVEAQLKPKRKRK